MEFVPVPNYPSYLISRSGDVMNLYGELKTWHRQRRHQGYTQCSLYKSEDKQMYTVCQHRLLAQAFIANPDNLPHVDHINGDSSDNRLENLRWVTRQENEFNKGLSTRNTTGEKFISWDSGKARWKVQILSKGSNFRRYRRTIEDAITVRDTFLATLI